MLHRFMYRVAWIAALIIMRAFFDFRTYGRRNIPRTGGVILAVNHSSFLDPIIIGAGDVRPVHFMARDTLFTWWLGWLISRLNAFPVARGGSDKSAVKAFVKRVQDGNVVMLFPEGTRTSDGKIAAIQPGVGAMGLRAGVPIVPTYIHGGFKAWPRQHKLPRTSTLTIYYGKPIYPEDFTEGSKKKRIENLRSTVEQHLLALEEFITSSSSRPAKRGA